MFWERADVKGVTGSIYTEKIVYFIDLNTNFVGAIIVLLTSILYYYIAEY